ncbi:alkyl hydroperoxide reductase subunit F [Orenia metallireducens]|jgi:alkyl hydroperoxide reductase subunit F|uniref:Alkyl hydroperoxide reductase subunit F n=1 Tax=Orenia metallireducens TaxID=1413210 RepID=A0A285HFL0_9FIRM|nr:FAD-dependent oxidoreductase [Orenia metallireducens]PRX27427.1 alkyl hydroperoxide reductase subunit F [Orenia metallireducens]SNY34373.1 alkyl hydroperoxide reductase subunit F [Orenia metallireducens]
MESKLNLKQSDQLHSKNKAIALDSEKVYEILIIGGGPAGLSAAIYCMRKGIETGLITEDIGGQLLYTIDIENYIGYRYIEGAQLVEKFRAQVEQFEIGFEQGSKVTAIDINDKIKKVSTAAGKTYQARALIIATGKVSRTLGIAGEEELTGRGVSYCATCDAPLYRGKKVIVVGGGNSGVEASIDLAKLAEQVTLIQDQDRLTADQILIDKLDKFNNVNILTEHELVEIKGEQLVNSVVIRDKKNNQQREMEINGVFVEIGLVPNTEFIDNKLELNPYNEIVIDCECKASVEGVFAAGDVTSVPFKQIIIAAGEGSKAALVAYDYILKLAE